MNYWNLSLRKESGLGSLSCLAILLLLPLLGHGQALSNYRASWVGNTWGGKDKKHVQDYILEMTVQPDGTCYTNSQWDEAHCERGVYKDGNLIGCNSPDIDSKVVGGWSIQGNKVVGNGKEIILENPTALAIATNGNLMVAENGRRKQILFYDVSKNPPTLVRTFGEEGGISAGTPGQVTPTKFWGLSGVGMDNVGNIYVSMNENGCAIRSFTPSGSLRWQVEGWHFVDVVAVDPASDGRTVYGLQEKYAMDYTKTTPGSEWKLEGYTLDSYRFKNDPRGLEIIKADHEHGLTSAVIRYINGKKFLFANGMTCQWWPIFREENGIFVPSVWFSDRHRVYDHQLWWPLNIPTSGGRFIWRDMNGDGDYQSNEYTATNYGNTGPWYVDSEGGIWGSKSGNAIFRYVPQGLDTKGNPIYSDASVQTYTVPGVTRAEKIVYLPESKIMIVVDGGECRRLGGKVMVFENWGTASQRQIGSSAPRTEDNPCGLAAAGDYYFTTNCWGQYGTGRATVYAYRISDGGFAGEMRINAEMNDGTVQPTMVDIGYPLTAFKRSNGEYLVFVEDDQYAKVVMYRWCPTGNCTESCDQAIVPSAPSNTTASGQAGQIQLSWSDNSSNETGFRIEARTGSGAYTQVGSVGANTTSFTHSSLADNTTYTYRVLATNCKGNSAYSNEASATTLAERTEGGSITVSSTNSPSGEGPEKAFDNMTSSKWLVFASSGWISYDFASEQAYAVNQYTVASANDSPGRDPKNWSLKGSNDGTSWTTLDSRSNESFTSRFQTKTYTISNTTAYKLYRLEVSANNGAAELQIAEIQLFGPAGSTAPDTQAPTAPTNLAASSITASSVVLTWSASTDNVAVAGYDVYNGTTKVNTATITTTTYTVTGLTANTTYSFTVKARDAAGNQSAASSALGVTTAPPAGTVLAKNVTSAITVDGNLNETAWSVTNPVSKTTAGSPNNTVQYGVLWNSSYLYIGVRVSDGNLYNDSPNDWDDDGVEIYIDGDNNGATSYDAKDRQFIKGYNSTSLFEKNNTTTGVLHATTATSGGYTVEIAIPWSNLGITPAANLTIGFDVANNDDDNGGGRDHQAVWWGNVNNWTNTSAFGDLVLSSTTAARKGYETALDNPSSLVLYPNPASEQVTVSFHAPAAGKGQVLVYDGLGKSWLSRNQTFRKGANQFSISTTSIPAGVYLLKIEVANQQWVQKLLIQRF